MSADGFCLLDGSKSLGVLTGRTIKLARHSSEFYSPRNTTRAASRELPRSSRILISPWNMKSVIICTISRVRTSGRKINATRTSSSRHKLTSYRRTRNVWKFTPISARYSAALARYASPARLTPATLVRERLSRSTTRLRFVSTACTPHDDKMIEIENISTPMVASTRDRSTSYLLSSFHQNDDVSKWSTRRDRVRWYAILNCADILRVVHCCLV